MVRTVFISSKFLRSNSPNVEYFLVKIHQKLLYHLGVQHPFLSKLPFADT